MVSGGAIACSGGVSGSGSGATARIRSLLGLGGTCARRAERRYSAAGVPTSITSAVGATSTIGSASGAGARGARRRPAVGATSTISSASGAGGAGARVRVGEVAWRASKVVGRARMDLDARWGVAEAWQARRGDSPGAAASALAARRRSARALAVRRDMAAVLVVCGEEEARNEGKSDNLWKRSACAPVHGRSNLACSDAMAPQGTYAL